jgi:hypothetical protein
MFSSEQYHAKAAEYLELAAKTESSNNVREYRDLARSYAEIPLSAANSSTKASRDDRAT